MSESFINFKRWCSNGWLYGNQNSLKKLNFNWSATNQNGPFKLCKLFQNNARCTICIEPVEQHPGLLDVLLDDFHLSDGLIRRQRGWIDVLGNAENDVVIVRVLQSYDLRFSKIDLNERKTMWSGKAREWKKVKEKESWKRNKVERERMFRRNKEIVNRC